MNRSLKERLKGSLRTLFELGQRLGVDVLPRHFYSEIPDIRRLRADPGWRRRLPMHGVAGTDVDAMLATLGGWVDDALRDHFAGYDVFAEASAANGEPGFGVVEAHVLFGFVATQQPAQIVQVGCGHSTAVCVAAAEHAGYEPVITCVEPWPNALLRRLAGEGRIRLIAEPVQDVDPERLTDLAARDLFFVDSSHTLGPAGEVTRIVLDLLPRLRPGVAVHFHDIKFPYDYERRTLESTLFFPHETALLLAWLTDNPRAALAVSLSMLHYDRQDELRALLPMYAPAPSEDGLNAGPGHFPSSTWIEITG